MPGMRAAASALFAARQAQDVLAHNLANSQTVGFRRRVPVFSGFGTALKAAGAALDSTPNTAVGTVMDTAALDLRSGLKKETGEPLDLALEQPDVFFVVRTPEGERLTRNGRFSLNNNGELVNQLGFPVVRNGDGKAFKLPSAGKKGAKAVKLSVRRGGEIYAGTALLGTLKLVKVPPREAGKLVSNGGDLFRYAGKPVPATGATVLPGTLESSNVQVQREMIELILNVRGTEMAATALKIQDEGLGRALQDLAG